MIEKNRTRFRENPVFEILSENTVVERSSACFSVVIYDEELNIQSYVSVVIWAFRLEMYE